MSRYKSLVVILCHVICISKISCGPVEHSIQLSDDKIERIKQTGEDLNVTLSPEIDPCNDFYRHVCRKFNLGRLNNDDRKEMENILEKYLQESDLTGAELKLKKYQKSCEQGEDPKQFVREFKFDSIKGWPALDPDWKADQFDLEALLTEMQNYFTSRVVGLRFKTVDTGYTDLFYITRGRVQIEDKLKEAGVENVDDVISDAIQFEEDCRKVLEPNQASDWDGTETKSKNFKMETLHKVANTVNSPVLVKGTDSARNFFAEVSKMNPKIVANYMFCLFVAIIPVLEYRQTCHIPVYEYFDPVIFGMFIKRSSEEGFNTLFSGMARSVVKNLNELSTAFEGLSADELPSADDLLNEDYFSRFSDDNLNREYQEVDIDENKFIRNTFLLRRWKRMKKSSDSSNKSFDITQHLRSELDTIMLLTKRNELSSIIYNNIATHLASEYVNEVFKSKRFRASSFQDCLRRQWSTPGAEINEEIFVGLSVFQKIVKGYHEWADQNKDIVQAENDILKEYGLSSQKVLLLWYVQLYCRLVNPATVKLLEIYGMNLQELEDIYSCPVGSPINPKEKCSVA